MAYELTATPEQLEAERKRLSTPEMNQPITGADLAPVQAPQIPPQPPEPDYNAALQAIDLKGFLQPTAKEQEQDDLSTRILELTKSYTGIEPAQIKAEEKFGVTGLRQQLADVTGQIQTLQKEALAIPLRLQEEATGRGITRGGLQPIEAGELRQNAIKALGLSAIGQTLQGNLALATQQANRAVELEFAPQQRELDILKTVYQLNKDVLERQDKRRTEALRITLAERERLLEENKASKQRIFDIMREAARSGADNTALEMIRNASSPDEAIRLAGFSLGQEFREKVRQQQFQEDLQKTQVNLSYEKFKEDTRQFDLQYALKKQELEYQKFKNIVKADPIKAAEATSEIFDNKIQLIDSLLTSPGLKGSVGPYRVSRFTPLSIDKAARQEFSAGVTQLINKETIDTLVNLKARGGALGALSDQERLLLQSAATKIGSWEIKDDKGFGTGRYAISEEAFKRELNIIRELAIKAQARALGGGPVNTNNEAEELRASGYSEEQIKLLLKLE